MKNLQFNLIICISFLVFSSCSKTFLTQETRSRIQSSGTQNIENVQFYIDESIVIEFKTNSSEETISGGKVKFQDGYYYYTIVFPKNTPAIAEHLDGKRIKVFFENGSDRYLVFGQNDDNYYQLYGDNSSSEFYVNFEGKKMRVVQGENAYLLIKKNLEVNVDKESRKVKGIKVGS